MAYRHGRNLHPSGNIEAAVSKDMLGVAVVIVAAPGTVHTHVMCTCYVQSRAGLVSRCDDMAIASAGLAAPSPSAYVCVSMLMRRRFRTS
jgi:hypothetical protein